MSDINGFPTAIIPNVTTGEVTADLRVYMMLSGWVDVRSRPNVIGDGLNVDEGGMQQAATDCANGKRRLLIPPVTTTGTPATWTGTDGNTVDFTGVPEVWAVGAQFSMIRPLIGDNTDWTGGRFSEGPGTSAASIVRVQGSNVNLDRIGVSANAHAFTCIHVQSKVGGTRPDTVNITRHDLFGRSCITVFGSKDVSIDDGTIETNGDDGIVFKDSLGEVCEGWTVNNQRTTTAASIAAVGTEILSTGGVRNGTVSNSAGTNTGHIALIKPGHVSYPNGFAEDITYDSCRARDDNGTTMSQPVAVTASNGATAQRIRMEKCDFFGRYRTIGGLLANIYISTTSGGKIGRVDLANCSFDDRYNGLPNDGLHPGNPPTYGALCDKPDATGTISNLSFDNVHHNGVGVDGFAVFVDTGYLRLRAPRVFNKATTAGTGCAMNVLSGTATVEDPEFDGPLNSWVRGAGTCYLRARGPGSPAGQLVAGRSSKYFRTDGAAGSTEYTKQANDTTSAGWAAIA